MSVVGCQTCIELSLTLAMHPTGIRLGWCDVTADYVGAAVINTALFLGIVLLHFLVVLALSFGMGKDFAQVGGRVDLLLNHFVRRGAILTPLHPLLFFLRHMVIRQRVLTCRVRAAHPRPHRGTDGFHPVGRHIARSHFRLV